MMAEQESAMCISDFLCTKVNKKRVTLFLLKGMKGLKKMGKISEKYKFLKNKDKKKKYIFKSGIFYIFLNEDAKYISEKYNLKLTSFGNDVKCGFPISAKDKYLSFLKNENISMIDKTKAEDLDNNFIKILNKVDLDNITPKEAIDVLYELKGVFYNE